MAIGIVMAQNRCDQQTAVRILTDASSNGNIKLRDIAASLVQSVGGSATRTHFEEPGRKEAV
jgi:AmiR/NasT family two-component response regulator